MAWLDDLITRLEDRGVGTFGQTIFASTQAVIPKLASGEASLQVIDTGGSGDTNTQNDTIQPSYLNTTAQITARADTFKAAFLKATAARQALFVRNTFINSGWYLFIKPLQNPFDGGADPRGGQAMVQFNVAGESKNPNAA